MAEVYPEIREVLGREKTLLFVYGAYNDTLYICSKAMMKKLEAPVFEVYDALTTARNYLASKEIVLQDYCLGTVCAHWGIELDAHEAFSDAKGCLGIIEHICKAEGIGIDKLIELYGRGSLISSSDTIRRIEESKARSQIQKAMNKSKGKSIGAVADISISDGGKKFKVEKTKNKE